MDAHVRSRLSRRQALRLSGAGIAAVCAAHRVAPPAGAQDITLAPTTPATTPGVATESGVPYGHAGGQPLLLDVYRPPARDAPRPAVLLFHGGALVSGDRTDMADAGLGLALAGYVAFAVGYRLFSEADGTSRWPAQLDDAQMAVRWVRTHAAAYGVDPARVAAYGASSGGQLAAFLATRETRANADPALAAASSRVISAVDLAGPVDWTIPLLADSINAVTAAVLGGTAAAPPPPAAYRDFSPIAFVDAKTAPFLILHGLADSIVPIANARRMTDALHAAGVEVMSGEFLGLDHFSWDWPTSAPWALAFLGVLLRPDA